MLTIEKGSSAPIAAIERETEKDIRRAAVNLVDTLVLERETNGQSKEFMDWAYFMAARAFKAQTDVFARQAEEMKRTLEDIKAYADHVALGIACNMDVSAATKILIDKCRARSLTKGESDAQG